MLGKTTCTFLMWQMGLYEHWSWETPAWPKIDTFSGMKYLHSAGVGGAVGFCVTKLGQYYPQISNSIMGKKWDSFKVINITVVTSVKYVGCSQDTACQDPTHLYNRSTNKCSYFDHLTLLHHVSCVLNWLIWFYAVLFWSDSLMMIPY